MPEYDIDYMCFDIKTQSLVQILGATTSFCTSSGKLKKSKYAGKVVLTSYPFISIEEEYADPLINELIKRNMDVVRNVNQKHVFLRKAHHVSTKVLVRALQACGVQKLRYVNFGTKMPVQDFRDMLEPHIVGDTFVVDVGTALPEGRHKDGYFTLFQPVERPDYRGRVTSDWAGFQAHITPHQMFLTEFGGFELDMKHVYDNVGKVKVRVRGVCPTKIKGRILNKTYAWMRLDTAVISSRLVSKMDKWFVRYTSINVHTLQTYAVDSISRQFLPKCAKSSLLFLPWLRRGVKQTTTYRLIHQHLQSAL
jgi:hypothetical protein